MEDGVVSLGVYADAWADCRRRQRFLLAVLLSYSPMVFGVAYPLWWLIGSLTSGSLQSFRTLHVLALAWILMIVATSLAAVAGLVLYAVTSTWLRSFLCPRCGRPFFRAGRCRNMFARRRLHCELPKWASIEPTLFCQAELP